jgi:hypothetical protein
MKYQVWLEGYQATGDYGEAQLLGEVEANTFKEACVKLLKDDEYFNEKYLTVWGCRLYDNEKEARKNFG